MKKQDILTYSILILLLLGDFLLLFHIIDELYGFNESIIAGIIGFIGAVIGGAITYIGVWKTLKHRDNERFLESAPEKLGLIDNFISKYSNYLNASALISMSNEIEESKNVRMKNLIESIKKDLDKDKEKMYKCLSFDELEIIDFLQKSIRGLSRKTIFNKNDFASSQEKISTVFNLFYVSKQNLRKNYYKHKNS